MEVNLQMALMQIDLNEDQQKKLALVKIKKDLGSKWEALRYVLDEYDIN